MSIARRTRDRKSQQQEGYGESSGGKNGGNFEFFSGNKNGLQKNICNPLICMARPGRFERPTAWFVARYSIQLSYGRKKLIHA
jgi:hypothetical protein